MERAGRRRRRRMRIVKIGGGIAALAGIAVAVALLAGGGGDGGTCTKGGPMSKGKKTFDVPPCMEIDAGKIYVATLDTSMGDIVLRMDAEKAPVTVNNFVFLARAGYYDGTVFHRVIKDFMNQGGDPEGTGRGGPGYRFEDETGNGLVFDRQGLLAMANAGPNTNGSQFFITVSTPRHLDGKHTIFGEVADGMAVVRAINKVPVGTGDRPKEDVVLRSVTIEERAG